jgi:phage shock protein C
VNRGRLGRLRRSLYRSNDGKVLGVFKGIAESRGYCVFWTRVVGAVVLLVLASAMGAHGLHLVLLVGGFFYLLLALLMQPPRQPGGSGDPLVSAAETRSAPRGYAPANVPPINRPRVDLAALDRQLDGLNRRIQRMETIVTDREYDWNRRMET